MSRQKAPRSLPKMAGTRVYGQNERAALSGNTVYKHDQKYHVFVGLRKVLVTNDLDSALTEAAQRTAV